MNSIEQSATLNRRSPASGCSAQRIVAILKSSGLDYRNVNFGKTHQAKGEYRICWMPLADRIERTKQIEETLTRAGITCHTDALHNINQAAVYLRLPNSVVSKK